MKAYKVTVLVVDHDELGGAGIKSEMDSVRYPSDCLSPEVMAIEERDIGEWHDGHPLNFADTTLQEYARLFGGNVKLRQLREDEVLFTLEAVGCCTDVQDNAFVSGDAEADKQIVDEILRRLRGGDVWAWASVTVTATWRSGFQARACLGGCSYANEEAFRQCDYYSMLKRDALSALQANLHTAFCFLQELEVPESHFDSSGLIHGLAGYRRALKDPENWSARHPDGCEYWSHEDWQRWPADGVETWSFRYDGDKPLTHEELNGID